MLKPTLRWLIWPVLLVNSLGLFAYGMSVGQPIVFFNLAYLCLAASLFFLERFMPHERAWLGADGQLWQDLAHTLSSKGLVQGLLIFGGVIGLSAFLTPAAEQGRGIWPREWPMAAQVILGIVSAEFMLYWAHRLSHRWPPMWAFHAIHHSVKRLWIVNTGRFHFVDSLISIVMGLGLLLYLGAPMEVVKWLSAVTAFIGMLTHCNVEMKFGPISWLFNTPELHRWHHSKDLREGDKNFGENVMLWDWVFGSYFNENRRPPVDIGIKQAMPVPFIHQLMYPFRRKYYHGLRSSRTEKDPHIF
jgi:sterol desaturase/sphingolipid hydroxylase (fatty acid hydroxylase superfamily)|tara:strand:- start:50567 stop:51472 length:906 start_codon:yes stop_codon:yes gene_type:complete